MRLIWRGPRWAAMVLVLAVGLVASPVAEARSGFMWRDPARIEATDLPEVVVGDGRVWIARSTPWSSDGTVDVLSRRLSGRSPRVWRFVAPPPPGFADGTFRASVTLVGSGRVFVVTSWRSVDDMRTEGRLWQLAAPDGRVVAWQLPVDAASAGPRPLMVGLVPPPMGEPARLPRSVSGLYDAVTGVRSPWIPTTEVVQAAGRFVAEGRYLAEERRIDGSGGIGKVVNVVDFASGKRRYRVRIGDLARAVTSGRRDQVRRDSGPIGSVVLRQDGTLGVGAWNTRGGGVRPVFVDERGRIRRVGKAIPRATSVSTVPARRRVMVAIDGPRACRGVWLTDRAGRRGYSLTGESIALRPPPAVSLWFDGRSAVWTDTGASALGTVPGTAIRRGDILMRTHLDRLPLRRGEVPRCR